MAFGGGLEQSDEVLSEINMVPLIDVMLVMLIIFMLAAPILTQAVKVDLPRTAGQASDTAPGKVTVTVMADGSVLWNDLPVDAGMLESKLRQAGGESPQPLLQIQGDRAVAYERVLNVLSLAQRSGVATVGFMTEPGRSLP